MRGVFLQVGEGGVHGGVGGVHWFDDNMRLPCGCAGGLRPAGLTR